MKVKITTNPAGNSPDIAVIIKTAIAIRETKAFATIAVRIRYLCLFEAAAMVIAITKIGIIRPIVRKISTGGFA